MDAGHLGCLSSSKDSTSVSRRVGLPFIRISVSSHKPTPTCQKKFAYAMIDSGSSKNMMSLDFFNNTFPRATVTRTDKTLTCASKYQRIKVRSKTELYVSIEGSTKQILLCMSFLLVPLLAYDLYLGQPFLCSPELTCYTPDYVFLDPAAPETPLISNKIE